MKVCLFHNHDSHLRCNHLRCSLSAWCVLLGWLFAMVFFLTSRCIGDAYLTKKASAHAAMLCVDNMLITLGRSLFNWVYMWVGRAGGLACPVRENPSTSLLSYFLLFVAIGLMASLAKVIFTPVATSRVTVPSSSLMALTVPCMPPMVTTS